MKDERASPQTLLWGIYHTDREYARVHGDPLRTVIEARTKLAAEEQAARLGFGEPWAHLVTPEEAKHAQWISTRPSRIEQVITQPMKCGIRV
jgi:hypothetical protein